MTLKSLIIVLESLKEDFGDMDVAIKEDEWGQTYSTYGVEVDFYNDILYILTKESFKSHQ